MDEFFHTHLWGKEVDVCCGGPDCFKGKVVSAANNILILESKRGVYTHVTVDRILALWLKDQLGQTQKSTCLCPNDKRKFGLLAVCMSGIICPFLGMFAAH
ncbi:MAG: MM0924 family protein [archaeon]